MNRPETGRSCQYDNIRQWNCFQVSVKAYELVGVSYCNLGLNVAFFVVFARECFITFIKPVAKRVRHCNQFDILFGKKSLERSTCATTAASYYRDFYSIIY